MSNCRSCGAEILWANTVHGKKIPLDARPVPGIFRITAETEVEDGTVIEAEIVLDAYHSHFATCPNADEHRRKDV